MNKKVIIAIEPDYSSLPNVSIIELGRVEIIRETKLLYRFKDEFGKERFVYKDGLNQDCWLRGALNAMNGGTTQYKGFQFFTPSFTRICLLSDKAKNEKELLIEYAKAIQKQVDAFNEFVKEITFN